MTTTENTPATTEPTPVPLEVVKPDPVIPADLKAQIHTIQAFAQTHNMLASGTYPWSHFKAVGDCVEFIKTLHAHAIDAAAKHEKADLVPELKAWNETKALEEKKTEETVSGQA